LCFDYCLTAEAGLTDLLDFTYWIGAF